MAITPLWTTVRTFVNVAAEGHAADPLDAAFIAPREPHDTDLLIDFSHCTFANAPNSGTFWLWSWHNDGAISIKSKFAEIIVAGSESGYMMPVVVRNGPSLITITLDAFNGGAVPTVSGTVSMRRLFKP